MASKNLGGRPTVVTKEVLLKLEEAFKIGCTDLEACLFADISKTALYNYQDANHKFKERKDILKETPVFIARTTVVKEIATDADLAMKYLERKCKKEFSTKTESEVTGADGAPLDLSLMVKYV